MTEVLHETVSIKKRGHMGMKVEQFYTEDRSLEKVGLIQRKNVINVMLDDDNGLPTATGEMYVEGGAFHDHKSALAFAEVLQAALLFTDPGVKLEEQTEVSA